MAARDEFSQSVKETLAKRVGYRCSLPSCRAATIGATQAPGGAASVGVAAHLTAAAPGGPRYDPSLTPKQRASAENGIWACQTCSRLIDVDLNRFTLAQLVNWKAEAEAEAMERIGRAEVQPSTAAVPSSATSNPVLRLAIYRRLLRRNLTGGTRLRKLTSDLAYEFDPVVVVAAVRVLGQEDLLHWHKDPLEPGTRIYLGSQRDIGVGLQRWEEFEAEFEGDEDRFPRPGRRMGTFPRR